MGVKISLISESISIMVIDLFKFDSGFSSGRLLILLKELQSVS